MQAFIYKLRRRDKDGTMKVSPLYRARIRLQGEARSSTAPENHDKMVAEKRMAELVTSLSARGPDSLPRALNANRQFPLTKHQEDYIADLVALGRTKKYSKLVMARFTRLAAECKWRYPGDISTNSFVSWRSTQKKLSPKTLNEYLNAGNALLNWMVRQGRVSYNPLHDVAHADVRGHQQHRRAFTEAELTKLLAVASPQRRLLYLAAAFTGLRAGGIETGHMGRPPTDCERPHIRVRALTAKNRKECHHSSASASCYRNAGPSAVRYKVGFQNLLSAPTSRPAYS
jgi:integrase